MKVRTGSDWKPVTYTTEDGVEKNVTIRTGYEIIERTEAVDQSPDTKYIGADCG